jgi:y4mF family transcriptional regulator
MRINSMHALAAAARGRRVDLGLSQAQLAAKAGVSRDWVNSFERGKRTVELALVLRVLEALDLRIDVTPADEPTPADTPERPSLGSLLDAYLNR